LGNVSGDPPVYVAGVSVVFEVFVVCEYGGGERGTEEKVLVVGETSKDR
jgi:hypothetical protein